MKSLHMHNAREFVCQDHDTISADQLSVDTFWDKSSQL